MWVGTCIGLLNYKFYWQFLLYACLSLATMFITLIVIDGMSVLMVFAGVFLFDFGFLFVVQTARVVNNKTATDKSQLQGENDIFRKKSGLENWEQVFTTSIFSWILPINPPDPKQALDYGALIPPGGLIRKPDEASKASMESIQQPAGISI